MEEFITPDFLSGCDVDTIHEKMMTLLPDDIDKTEAGFAWDFTRPAALIAAELLEFYIPEIIKLMFPQWSNGKYLDYLAKMARVERKAPNFATSQLKITGSPGTIIPTGTVFATPATSDSSSIEFAALEDAVIGDDGTVMVTVQALIAGTGSNVNAGTITLMSVPIDGINGVSNAEKATGGTEEESDDELRERILAANSSMDTSYIGNASDYKRWAEAVPGIGTVIIVPEWAGPETVKIVALDANGEAANESLCKSIYEYIMQPDSPLDRLAPPNTILTVTAPTLVHITYQVSGLSLDDGYEKDAVIKLITAKLASYYKTASDAGMVKYTQVCAAVSSTPGVSDYESLTMNGDTKNISIASDEYPYTDEVVVDEAEEVSDG